MEKYKIFFKKSTLKELEKVPQTALQKIIKKIQKLSDNSKPVGSQKLSNYNLYRIRQGNYRVAYFIDNKKLEIQIFKIGHRKNIYKF